MSAERLIATYRGLAYVVGVCLIVLVLVGVPLQFAASRPEVVNIVGPIHGILYFCYLVVGYQLVRRLHLSWWTLLAIAAAGLLPFLTFVVERAVRRRALAALHDPVTSGERGGT